MKRLKHICKDFENIETHSSDGERRLVNISVAELKALDMYYNRPASELVFLRRGEHSALHNSGENNSNYGKHLSEETRNKISKNGIGRHWYNNGQINKFCYECPDGFTPGQLHK